MADLSRAKIPRNFAALKSWPHCAVLEIVKIVPQVRLLLMNWFVGSETSRNGQSRFADTNTLFRETHLSPDRFAEILLWRSRGFRIFFVASDFGGKFSISHDGFYCFGGIRIEFISGVFNYFFSENWNLMCIGTKKLTNWSIYNRNWRWVKNSGFYVIDCCDRVMLVWNHLAK